VDVEVEQSGRAMSLLTQQPCERSRDGRGADASTDAHDGGHDVRLVDLRFAARPRQDRLGMGEGVTQVIDRERLQKVVVDAAGDEVAIQADIVNLARCDYDRPRLADFRKRVDVVQRVSGLRQVDEQDVRARGDRQRLDRIAQATLVDLLRRPAVLDSHGTQHVSSRVVANEGLEWISQPGACLERSVHHFSSFFVLMSCRPLLPVVGAVR